MNWPFWLELLGRSAALLLVGVLLHRGAKRTAAAFRHRLLLWVFALLFLLPLFSVLFPVVPISIAKPALEQRGVVTADEMSSMVAASGARASVDWALWVWLTGVVATSAPLVLGTIRIRRVSGRACAFGESGDIEVRISDELRVPVTFGLAKPRVILPGTAREWSRARFEAVIAHERAHIQRRDVAIQFAVHIVTALWWFQPLAWMLRSKLRRESEFACDQEAMRLGFRPSDYASELLAVARDASYARVPLAAIAMVRSSDLEDRVRAILDSPKPSMRTPRAILLGLALGGAAIAASSFTVRSSEPTSDRTGASMMKRTILSALLASAGLSAATVSGVVHDASNAPAFDAIVTLLNPDTGYKAEATTDANGAFTFSGSAAGQYILRIQKSGFTSILREFDVKGDTKQNSEFTLTPAGEQPIVETSPDNSPVNGEPPKIVRIGGLAAQSNLVAASKIVPIYPVAAKKAGIQGTVEIKATISNDGVPVALAVVSSPSDDLSQSALEAVRQWRYRPTLLNGNPITVVTTIVVNYTLAN